VIVKYVREGRNYGLSFVVATQQPAAIDPGILAQVDTLIVHKLTVQSDIDYVRKNIKSNLPEEVRYGNSRLDCMARRRAAGTGGAEGGAIIAGCLARGDRGFPLRAAERWRTAPWPRGYRRPEALRRQGGGIRRLLWRPAQCLRLRAR